ncbi:MAG TPA: hypothetical protein VNF68_12765 [Candidatus Baltobacteraceae bacterium]|nr:hypothetical protein [Candidatus Baltobacteraceae bacterium]
MHVRVGDELLDLALATGARSLFVVGTGKNVGKTVAMRAVYEAALARGLLPGITSIGRDGEAVDASDAGGKPRLFLWPGTVVATAAGVLPTTPACEAVDLSRLRTAAGQLVYVRVRSGAYYELVGPPTASGIREAVTTLLAHAPYAIVDGAVDRVAALAGGGDAVVVAAGASANATPQDAVQEVRALVARLAIPQHDGTGDVVRIDGALGPAAAAEFIRSGERRTILLRDATQFVLAGRSALTALERLRVRCEHPLRVVAVTVCSAGRDRWFEPRAFARDVAAATGLPTFDVYAAERAA